jgi:hypothetical protein
MTSAFLRKVVNAPSFKFLIILCLSRACRCKLVVFHRKVGENARFLISQIRS